MDLTIIVILLIIFFIIIMTNVNPNVSGKSFMDKNFCNGLKGIASVLIIFAHIPSPYNNILTEVILSFGFTYVTLFFLISAYGFKYSVEVKGDDYLKGFWKKRLKALFIPAILVNIINVILESIAMKKIMYLKLFQFNGYIYVIMIVYFIMWCVWSCKLISNQKKDCFIIVTILILALITMYSSYKVMAVWPVDSIGAVWGIIIFRYKDNIYKLFSYKHKMKLLLFGSISFVLGILYLKYKHIFFVGEFLLKVILGFFVVALYMCLCYKCTFSGGYLKWLGEISYETYLIHIVIISFLKTIMPDIRGSYFVLLVVSISLILATIINNFTKKFLNER